MKKKKLESTPYMFIMATCIVFIVILSTSYILRINKIHVSNINEIYRIVEGSKKETIKEIIDNTINEIDIEREYTYIESKKSIKGLEKIVEVLSGEDLKDYIKELPSVESFIWDKEQSKVVYSENTIINEEVIKNNEDLENYLKNYEFYIDKELKNSKQLLILGISKENFEKKTKSIIERKIRNTKLNDNKYISIKEVVNYDGGYNYAKNIVNPYDRSSEGKYRSTNDKDHSGNLIFKEELEGIKKYGETFYNIYYDYPYDVSYKKDKSEKDKDIVYSKLYPEYNWIISTSTSIDDIKDILYQEIKSFEKDVRYQISITIVTAISCFIIAGILAVTIYNSKKLRQRELDKQKSKIILQHYNILENKYDQTKQVIHDIKNHLICIKGLAKELDVKKVIEYVDSINTDISQLSHSTITGNRLVDIIINEKTLLMKESNINFTHEIQNINMNFISDKDVCTIITNLLDNAIDSCKKSESKNILLKIHCFNNSFIIIKLINSCDEGPMFKLNKFITSKKEDEFHGYGIRNINKSIKRYSGNLDWEYNEKNREFHMVIMIPIEVDRNNQ
ncbi:GHKL domain-containing protein [[Clostridium] dakarense]|uniref:GHKL domain-containing protein n=1 Tax=Faecalimicrobium dakarense TaxID=1301100 RepID=UPI0004B54F28|nr:GHKL domain-containing protein [[Clostridium] dakarense]